METAKIALQTVNDTNTAMVKEARATWSTPERRKTNEARPQKERGVASGTSMPMDHPGETRRTPAAKTKHEKRD
jgi:hypothetical protein